MRTSPAFATRSIEVTGHAHLTRAQVLAAAQLAVGENVFVTAPEDAQAALRSHPWVASATVTRRLPDTFEVHLQERTPVALLALDQLYLVGADGSVFKPLEPSDPSDMPVITGIDPDAFARDRSYRTSVLVNAVALLHDYRDVGLWRRTPIAEIHALPGEAFLLYVGKEETQVRLGKRPFRKKLRRFRKVIDQLERQKAVADYVYLDNVRRPDRVTVRLRVQ